MGTRSFIALQTDTAITGVYCHWDGYLSHNGKILRCYYRYPKKVAQLIALGDISSLAPDIGEKHDFDDRPEGQTTYYHRDRGEDWEANKPQHFKTIKALCNYAEDCGCEYLYLFDGRKWQYAERGAQFFGMSDGSPFSAFQPLPQKFDD
jgi:hypothetical protein